jgi:hypothetical protein
VLAYAMLTSIGMQIPFAHADIVSAQLSLAP